MAMNRQDFDRALTPVEAAELGRIETKVSKLMRATTPLAIELGKELKLAKKLVGHGNFGRWCNSLNFSSRMAENYMSIADLAGEHGEDAVEGLSIAALAALAAPSTPREVIVEVLKEAKGGDRLTAREVRVRIISAKTDSEPSEPKRIDEAELLEILRILQPLHPLSLRRFTNFLNSSNKKIIMALHTKIQDHLSEMAA